MAPRATVLLVTLLVGCCPRPGHRGITPDGCALRSEAACRQQCAELPTGGTEDGPVGQEFAGFRRDDFCACADPTSDTFAGNAVQVGEHMAEIDAAWVAWRARHDEPPAGKP